MKQETLAEQLGISQQAVSKMEQSEQVEDLTLEHVAKALGITKEAIRNYNDETVFNLIQHNTFNDSSSAAPYQCTFNPFDKIVELYDALLKSEKEEIRCFISNPR